MSKLEDYANKYQCVRFERRNGILQMTLHTDGGSLRWGFGPHGELPDAFYDVGNDRENRVVIITGTGAEFSGPRATPGTTSEAKCAESWNCAVSAASTMSHNNGISE